MAAELERTPDPSFDGWERQPEFALTLRDFMAEFQAAIDAGVDLGTILRAVEAEGVQLPDFVRMML